MARRDKPEKVVPYRIWDDECKAFHEGFLDRDDILRVARDRNEVHTFWNDDPTKQEKSSK